MTTTTKPHPTDQIPQLIARARAAEDERDALARKVVDLAKRLNRGEPDPAQTEASALLTRQLHTAQAERDTAQAELAAAREELALLTRQLKRASLADADPRQLERAQAAITALRDANVLLTHERERLCAANEALTEQVRVLRLANRTLARGGGNQ